MTGNMHGLRKFHHVCFYKVLGFKEQVLKLRKDVMKLMLLTNEIQQRSTVPQNLGAFNLPQVSSLRPSANWECLMMHVREVRHNVCEQDDILMMLRFPPSQESWQASRSRCWPFVLTGRTIYSLYSFSFPS